MYGHTRAVGPDQTMFLLLPPVLMWLILYILGCLTSVLVILSDSCFIFSGIALVCL